MNMTYLVLGLGIAWVLQFLFSFFQMRRFYARISQLRREHQGSVAIGMAGSAWRRRQYAVLVVDQDKRILAVEQLSGWTVLAKLRPVDGLAGLHTEDLFNEEITFTVPIKQKLLLALRNAAEQIDRADEQEDASDSESTSEEDALVDAAAMM